MTGRVAGQILWRGHSCPMSLSFGQKSGGINRGADALVRAGPPGRASACPGSWFQGEERDEGVPRGPGGPRKVFAKRCSGGCPSSLDHPVTDRRIMWGRKVSCRRLSIGASGSGLPTRCRLPTCPTLSPRTAAECAGRIDFRLRFGRSTVRRPPAYRYSACPSWPPPCIRRARVGGSWD